MSGVNNVVNFYNYLLETKSVTLSFLHLQSDPRTEEWFLMKGPGPVLMIIATYLYFCVWAGPRFMRDRNPYELKYMIMLYNAVQVAMSIFLVYEGILGGWFNGYSFTCQPVDLTENPKAMKMASAVWWYFFCKITELLDTVFFVLRKKTNQVTFLHLYHHSMMPICSWVGAKFLPGGHGTLLGFINSFIHIIMYAYYLVASMGPQYQKYIWWKKHLTEMQMTQFCLIFLHNTQVLFRQCDYPKTISFLLGLHSMFFFYLFGRFYYRSYITKVYEKKIENNNVQNGKLKEN